MTIDIEPLKKELGRKIEDEDVVTQAPLKAMIATFDRPDKVPGDGEAIAPGWHLCFLHSYARRASLGKDGAAAAAHVCRLDFHLRRRHPGRRQAPARARIHRHPASPGEHRDADRHDVDPADLHAPRSRAQRGRQHGVPRGSEGG